MPVNRLALFSIVCVSLSLSVPGALRAASAANVAACGELDRRFEFTQQDITSLQLNILLFSAADHGCEATAARLLEAGASVEARDRLGAMPLAHAAKAGHSALIELLLRHGAPINARSIAGSTALFAAAENDRLAAVRLLLDKGADVNLPGRSGLTPIAAAAYKGSVGIVDLLLAHGADPNAIDATGKGPLPYAAALGFTDVVRRLLDAGVDPNTPYGNDLTALMWAAGYPDGAGALDAAKVVNLLLERGAFIDAADNRGRTALMIAAERGHAAIVEILLQHGANGSLKDKEGKVARDLAATDDVRAKLTAK
jgi:ankyrin repeat protein